MFGMHFNVMFRALIQIKYEQSLKSEYISVSVRYVQCVYY